MGSSPTGAPSYWIRSDSSAPSRQNRSNVAGGGSSSATSIAYRPPRCSEQLYGRKASVLAGSTSMTMTDSSQHVGQDVADGGGGGTRGGGGDFTRGAVEQAVATMSSRPQPIERIVWRAREPNRRARSYMTR